MKRSVTSFATTALTIVLLVISAVSVTPQQISAEAILTRMAQALGGLEKLRQIENIYTRGKVEAAGLKGTVDEWQTSRGQHKQIVDLGAVYKQTTIFDGTRGWIHTSNTPRVGVLACSSCGRDGGVDFRHADRHVGASED